MRGSAPLHCAGRLSNNTHTPPPLPRYPVLLTLFVVALAQAVVSHRALRLEKRAAKLLHWGWMSAALVCLCVALKASAQWHDAMSLPRFGDWLTVALCALFFAHFALGFLVLFYPGSGPLGRAAYRPLHMFHGIFLHLFSVFQLLKYIVERNAWIGCAYDHYHPATAQADPAAAYPEMPPGCKLSNGLGVVLLCMAMCASYVAMDLDPAGDLFFEARGANAREGEGRPIMS